MTSHYNECIFERLDTWGIGHVNLLVDLVARFQTPHTNSVIVTCRHDIRTVGVDTEARDAALMTHKHHLQTPVEVPHFDCKDTHKQLHAEAILFTERASLTCSILSAGYEIFEWIEKQKGGNIARVQVRFTLQHLAFEQVEHLQNSGTEYLVERRADSLAEVHLRQPSSDKRQTLSAID